MHDGASAASGHYSTLVMTGDGWVNCSDTCISNVSTTDALAASSAAYLCMYTREGEHHDCSAYMIAVVRVKLAMLCEVHVLS